MHNLVYHVNVLSATKKFPRKNSEKVFLKIPLYFEIVTQITNLSKKYRKRSSLKNYDPQY